jgi:hypothetical protein
MADDALTLQRRRVKLIVSILALPAGLLVLGLFSLGKLAWYEAAGAADVRAAVGKQVTLRLPVGVSSFNARDGIVRGELLSARYRFNDKFGFFDLEVRVGGLTTGLSPSELSGFSLASPETR